MNRIATSIIALVMGAQMAVADGPIVVELFTSQGCSSCPPADAFLGELTKRDDVLPLALHVDYWDYLGWKDEFADPAHTVRQRAYSAAAHKRMIFTPQMVIGGVHHVVGNRPGEALSVIDAAREPTVVDVTLVRENGQVSVTASTDQPDDLTVQLVEFDSAQDVVIKRGENAGKTITYHNVVRNWTVLGTWNGRSDYSADIDVSGAVAVIFQRGTDGRVVGAAQLR